MILLGQKDGHDVYTCQHEQYSDKTHWVMAYRSAGERHIIQEVYFCLGCTEEKHSLFYGGVEYKWAHASWLHSTKPKEFKYDNKPPRKRKYTKDILHAGAKKMYGEGSEVYVSEFHLPPSSGYVHVKCGKHNDIFSSLVHNIANASYVSCPSCLRESGYARKTAQEYQSHIDSIFGEGEYVLQFNHQPHRKEYINVLHKGCGMEYQTTLQFLHQGNGCGYCSAGIVYTQEHLNDKIKRSGADILATIEDYQRRDSEGRFSVTCNNCGSVFKIATTHISNGKVKCTLCSDIEKLNSIPEGWIWCVGTKKYMCIEHKYVYEGSLSLIRCKFCSGKVTKVTDTETMRYVLSRLNGDRYDYSESAYTGKEGKIEVRCRIHDHIFITDYHDHRKGCNHCPVCNDAERGWGRKGFYETDKPSNLYIVQLGDNHVKVGLSNNPRGRWRALEKESGLEVVPIKTWKGKACDLFDVEHKCHYYSGIEKGSLGTHFTGWKEVYDISEKETLLEFLENRLE